MAQANSDESVEVVDPEIFLIAEAQFGHRTKKDVACYMKYYIQICENSNLIPAPQMLYLFQSSSKKDFLSRLENNRASVYLPGNDPGSKRRLTDQDLFAVCKLFERYFLGKTITMDLRYNELENILSLCNLLKVFCPIKGLNLMYNPISDFGISSLKLAAVKSQTLVSLCLAGVVLSSSGSMEVADMLNNVPTLRYLNLSYCNLKLEALIALMIPIRNNTVRLEGLDITCPNLVNWQSRQVFVDQCSSMLKSSTYLKELHLGKMALDDFGLERLKDVLERNTVLRFLDLHGNKLNRDGARMLMTILQLNTTLEVLDIDSNHLTDEGVEYLANAVFENKSLKTLSMRFCTIRDEGLRYLAKAVEKGSIARIYVWQGVSLTGSGCKAFYELMQQRVLDEKNTDIIIDCVDDQYRLVENGHGGLRKWNMYTPQYGDYSHRICYDGFAEPYPQSLYAATS